MKYGIIPSSNLLLLGFLLLSLCFHCEAVTDLYKTRYGQVWQKKRHISWVHLFHHLEGWVEMLKEKPDNEKIVQELEKDVDRLRLVSDRFGKIGSTPQLEET